MKKLYRYLFIFSSAAVSIVGINAEAQATSFRLTITNLSPNVLSPTVFVSHNASFDLFDLGSAASSAVELLAETGNFAGVIGEASAAGPAVQDYEVASGGILAQGASGTAVVQADVTHPLLSFMSMLGISNDAFIGGTTGDGAISLFSGNQPLFGSYYITPQDVWDAGTEVNDEAFGSVGALGGGNGGIDENGFITLNHPGIQGIGGINGIPVSRDWTGATVASLTVAPVPEPATLLLVGSGIAGLAGIRARRRKTT